MNAHRSILLGILAATVVLTSAHATTGVVDNNSASATTESSEALISKSYDFLESGDSELALDGFNAVLKEDATNLSARLGQAMIFSDQLRHEDAFSSYDLIIKAYPNNAFAWNGRGLAAFNLEDFDEALSSFKKATSDQPMNGFFYESLAWVQLCRGDYSEAALAAKRAALLYNHNGETPSYPLLISYFANLSSGDKSEAAIALKYARNNKPANNQWPTPVFDYLAGIINAPDLISYVRDTAQETEAHTYIGLQLRSQDKAEVAKMHLDWVAQNGDERVFEHMLARTLVRKQADKVALLVQ
jgi:Tfp pilus assembly protein PilF